MSSRRLAVVVLAAAVVVGACGADDDGAAEPALTGAAARGQAIAQDRGCQSCHSVDGADRTGPTWAGLAGSDVLLDDGTTVVADRGYLVRSIADPGADRVDGFTVQMPDVPLTDDEVDDLVAYIETLADRP